MSKKNEFLEGDDEWEIDPEEGTPMIKRQTEYQKPIFREGQTVMPGEKLCVANEYYESSEGSYEFGNFIYSSIFGTFSLNEFPDQQLTIISVKRKNREPFKSPYNGSIVTCTIISRTDKIARCYITHVDDIKLPDRIRGLIRREYIREKLRDSAEMVKSFGVGDTVIARVVGIHEGDFILSTAEDSLGVANSISEAGYYMVPIDWTMMECPKTKVQVPKKVAKIIQNKNVDYWNERNAKLKKEANTKSTKS